MSETFEGRRNPFDFFGSSATQDDTDRGPDLSELMRQEAGRTAAEEAEHAATVAEPVEQPTEAPIDEVVAEPVAEPPQPVAEEPTIETTAAPSPLAAEPQPFVEEPVAAVTAEPDPQQSAPAPAAPAPPPVEAAVVPPVPVPAPTETVAFPPPLAARPPEPLDARKLWVLRILLLSNLAMMAMMLVLPHPLEQRTEYLPVESADAGGVTARAPRAVPVDPFAPPAPRRGLALPDDALFERALLLALDGDFDGACAQLEHMFEIQPDMNPAVAQLVHAHLGYYLRKAGRLAEALEHEAIAHQEAGRSQLPEELLRSARAAEGRGDGQAMRRAYAQFLLQEGQLSPEMRALVPEALLKLGDSYRVQAASGEEAAEERSR